MYMYMYIYIYIYIFVCVCVCVCVCMYEGESMHAYIHITQAQFGIPLAALHCAPQDCEQVLLQ